MAAGMGADDDDDADGVGLEMSSDFCSLLCSLGLLLDSIPKGDPSCRGLAVALSVCRLFCILAT
jgi:hypothetical protein